MSATSPHSINVEDGNYPTFCLMQSIIISLSTEQAKQTIIVWFRVCVIAPSAHTNCFANGAMSQKIPRQMLLIRNVSLHFKNQLKKHLQ